MVTEMYLTRLPRPPAVDGGNVALPKKLMLSTDMWNSVACPALSVSTSSKKPSTDTYVLLEGMGFFDLYLFELK